MITNIRKNIIGTTSFDAKFPKMRKSQNFIVYPMQDSGTIITVQSTTRIGEIDLDTGKATMSKPRLGGSFTIHLAEKVDRFELPQEDVQNLRQWIKNTGGPLVHGGHHVFVDNTGAMAL